MIEDTIIAISTPIGYGGLGVVRLSGRKSLSIAQKIFRSKGKRKLLPRALVFGHVRDFERDKSLDEGYLAYFPGPHSYTRENVVEIICHGSPVVLEEIVRLGVKFGARLAHPGEFTLRAYINGRIDLLQAEAVNDLITATSLIQARISFGQLEGKLSRKIDSIRGRIVHLLAQLEASIEFPEDGLRISAKQIAKILQRLIEDLTKLVESYDAGRAISEGLTLAILGRANVGKSTLFNALLEEERAIVSPHPGTTRDYLRERIKIGDSVFNLVDMAGLGRPSHPVEKEGVKKGKTLAGRADGLLFLFDSSRKESPEDLSLIRQFKDKKAIILFNKIDLPQKISQKKIRSLWEGCVFLEISALKKINLGQLKELIRETFSPTEKEGEEMIFHLREKVGLEEILKHLKGADKLLREGYPEEICAEEIRKAVHVVGQLTGEIRADDVIEDIFSRFCVGK